MPKNSSLVLATEREVRNAKPNGQRTEFRIKAARNLVLRVTDAGTKSWAFLYASPGSGQRRKLSIGTYPAKGLAEAKIEALRLTLAVQAGKDPLHEQQAERQADTFSSLARKYIDEHSKKFARGSRRSSATIEAERILRADILPTIGCWRAESVTRRHVMDVVEAVASRGAFVAADRALTIIRAIYNWANATGRLEVNPTLGLKKRNASRARERVLSDDEIRSLWQALERPSKLSAEIRDAYKLQLLLGLRIGEVLGASKSEVDLDRCVWIVPPIRTKAGREHRLPLSAAATDILRLAAERAAESSWLFPSSLCDGPIQAHSASTAMRRLQFTIGLKGVNTHDLRRTLATGLGNMGVPDEMIERILNHAPRTVASKHYNHANYHEPMRRALEAWSERVKGIVEGRSDASNVVLLRTGAIP